MSRLAASNLRARLPPTAAVTSSAGVTSTDATRQEREAVSAERREIHRETGSKSPW